MTRITHDSCPSRDPARRQNQAMFQAWRRWCAASLTLLLGACSTVVQVPSGVESVGAGASVALTLAQAEAGYNQVLQRHVNAQGEVDFAGLRDDTSGAGIGALQTYVRAIAATPTDLAPSPQARLAHLINAYNALSMYNVIASDIPASHEGWAKLRFFVLRKFTIGGNTQSLYAFENDLIRKIGEPRVHFALNCSARACPQLPQRAFTAQRLEQELEHETRRFFARATNLRVDHATRTVWLSEILKFYTEDFVPAHASDLIAYAQRYTSEALPGDYRIGFIEYDWTIANSRPR